MNIVDSISICTYTFTFLFPCKLERRYHPHHLLFSKARFFTALSAREGRDIIQVNYVSKYISVSVTYRYLQNLRDGAEERW